MHGSQVGRSTSYIQDVHSYLRQGLAVGCDPPPCCWVEELAAERDKSPCPVEYAFRDHDLATQRLRVVAETFEATTRSFVGEAVKSRPGVALDLGCGIGYTTNLVAETTGADRTIGIDQSERFLSIAAQGSLDRVSFVNHDVAELPLPGAPADLIFCRFLLTHLTEPRRMVRRWATQLRVGGLVLLDEVESIDTEHPAIRSYLAMVEALLERRKAHLYVGRTLHAMKSGPQLRRLTSRLAQFSLTISEAAAMFLMNLRSWRDDPFIRATYAENAISELEQQLCVLAESTEREHVRWHLRQMTFARE